jgi:hypothetical protein
MGLFGRAKTDFNDALDHYQRAKNLAPGTEVWFDELAISVNFLQEGVKKYTGVSDELILLANIYFAISTLNKGISTLDKGTALDEYLHLAAASIYHWKIGRGYTNNKGNGNEVLEMILSALEERHPGLSNIEINSIVDQLHKDFYEKVLTKDLHKSKKGIIEYLHQIKALDSEYRKQVKAIDSLERFFITLVTDSNITKKNLAQKTKGEEDPSQGFRVAAQDQQPDTKWADDQGSLINLFFSLGINESQAANYLALGIPKDFIVNLVQKSYKDLAQRPKRLIEIEQKHVQTVITTLKSQRDVAEVELIERLILAGWTRGAATFLIQMIYSEKLKKNKKSKLK